jgi:hypothetical protein
MKGRDKRKRRDRKRQRRAGVSPRLVLNNLMKRSMILGYPMVSYVS